jgi:hypothetical protein
LCYDRCISWAIFSSLTTVIVGLGGSPPAIPIVNFNLVNTTAIPIIIHSLTVVGIPSIALPRKVAVVVVFRVVVVVRVVVAVVVAVVVVVLLMIAHQVVTAIAHLVDIWMIHFLSPAAPFSIAVV